MDYVVMSWETIEQLEELVRTDADLGDCIPPAIESAISLLRFEKIGRWESRTWEWEVPPAYDTDARRVADGKNDRRKQDALYVRIEPMGACARRPRSQPRRS